MGKGGQQTPKTTVKTGSSSINKDNWESPYKPLSKDAPEIPTVGQIKAVIPKHCFERSYARSFFYVARDLAMAGTFVYATSLVLSTNVPMNPIYFLFWSAGWIFYAFWMGTILTGPWVLAHECGHGAFSPNQTVNDVVGFVLHQVLLVPYFAWQYSHAKHHRRTNHLVDGESHVPSTAEENGINPETKERWGLYAAYHEAMGDGAFAAFEVVTHLFVGWPIYLAGYASTGRLAADGTPLNGRIMDHYRPSSPMFPEKMKNKITISTAGVIAGLLLLMYCKVQYGVLPVLLWYWGPYMWVNAWLVLYTWLQHTDPSIPHYGTEEWTWVKGALSTIDRPYGIFDFFHHFIGSTHVAHHLFHEMPWYHAEEATSALKEFLEPKGLYNFDPTPWPQALWKIAHRCHYVESREGIQFFKSFEDLPLNKDNKNLKKDK